MSKTNNNYSPLKNNNYQVILRKTTYINGTRYFIQDSFVSRKLLIISTLLMIAIIIVVVLLVSL